VATEVAQKVTQIIVITPEMNVVPYTKAVGSVFFNKIVRRGD
jgi:hypothetical protein